MSTIQRPARSSLLLLSVLASCAGDEPRHVFRSSPPARPAGPTTASAVSPELSVSTNGPTARVTAVLLASTGSPAPLDQIVEDIDVVTLVSRGRSSSAQGPARIELRVTGATDTTLVEHIGTPVPVMVAHAFRIPVSEGRLAEGRFQVQVRLVGPAGRQLATSVPVQLGVRSKLADEAARP